MIVLEYLVSMRNWLFMIVGAGAGAGADLCVDLLLI
jgi:hypothetical protein